MNPTQILFPMAGLAALTFAILLLIPYVRFKAARGRLVTADDFKLGESANVPAKSMQPRSTWPGSTSHCARRTALCTSRTTTCSTD
jgi:hypothetical protein